MNGLSISDLFALRRLIDEKIMDYQSLLMESVKEELKQKYTEELEKMKIRRKKVMAELENYIQSV